ncbi:pilus assembly protein [Pyxidicoccus parkwayensis]|uniref:Pilus assembly protein n=1 Tax=Pyxidicoccus parkwayensis TaxID=2813578 RepID=A0ABX7P3J1_9BACT|nr:TadE/TadG family type IV pilus assembly protein [Pyxidicoccus parkwaysis]QSQ25044.1 pilus assembly protein [Pyxidicoccus parkwaysis]
MRARHLRRHPRGAATVEFALSVPVLVMILMFSMYLTELVRAKLKLQEAARYAVWEMTSYALSDFAKGDNDAAFEDARKEAQEEWVDRYKDLDSVEPNGRSENLIARYQNVQGKITNKEIEFLESGMLGNPSTGEGGGLAGAILSPISNGAGWMLGQWGFNNKGWVESEVEMDFDNVILPKKYLQAEDRGFSKVDTYGGRSIANLHMKSKFSMYANGWNMPDGGDAIVRSRRAGQHTGGDLNKPHGLYKQVNRMVFLGFGNALDSLGIGSVLDKVALVLPNFLGTFVVSRNYSLKSQRADCNGLVGYEDQPTGGLHVMHKKKFELLDHERPDCFDTAPFRDEMTYGNSNYIKVYKARGEYYMGCKRPMADDPSDPDPQVEATEADEQDDKVPCE